MTLFERWRAGWPKLGADKRLEQTGRGWRLSRPRARPQRLSPKRVTCLADGVLGYHLFLGRAPEVDSVAEALVGLSLDELAVTFFKSAEFIERILQPVVMEGEPSAWQGAPPSAALQAPLVDALGLDRDLAEAARSWAEALGCLLDIALVRNILVQVHGERAGLLIHSSRLAFTKLKSALVERRKAVKWLQARAEGLQVLGVQDLEVEAGGGLLSLSDDPWFTVRPLISRADENTMLKLIVGLRAPHPGQFSSAAYLDYGDGFTDAMLIDLPTRGDQDVVFVFAKADGLKRIRIDPMPFEGLFRLERIALEPLTGADEVTRTVSRLIEDPVQRFYAERRARRLAMEQDKAPEHLGSVRHISQEFSLCFAPEGREGDYAAWRRRYETPYAADYARMSEIMAGFSWRPRFSFLLSTSDAPVEVMEACVASLFSQNYPHFDICIADERSDDGELLGWTDHLACDPRVHLCRGRHTHGGSGDVALAMAGGDYVVLLEACDVLPDYALFILADAINRQPDVKLLYADKDLIDDFGERWALNGTSLSEDDRAFTRDQAGRLVVYEATLVREVGGLRADVQAGGTASLAQRCRAAIGERACADLPHVLCHRRLRAGRDDDGGEAASRNLELAWPPRSAMPWLDVPERR